MKPPLYRGPLSSQQHQQLTRGLRAREGVKLRRCQLLLASACGERPAPIAVPGGCTAQPVRKTRRAYRADPKGCLRAGSSRPNHTAPWLAQANCERRRALLHESPRGFGKATRVWTLTPLAEGCLEQGLTPGTVSSESIRRARQRRGVSRKRATHWITSPDPRYALQKSRATG